MATRANKLFWTIIKNPVVVPRLRKLVLEHSTKGDGQAGIRYVCVVLWCGVCVCLDNDYDHMHVLLN
jgi:hypothetical protein